MIAVSIVQLVGESGALHEERVQFEVGGYKTSLRPLAAIGLAGEILKLAERALERNLADGARVT